MDLVPTVTSIIRGSGMLTVQITDERVLRLPLDEMWQCAEGATTSKAKMLLLSEEAEIKHTFSAYPTPPFCARKH